MRARIAPTPSGFLHVGNAFNFLVIAELVKTFGGTLVLRIDDLDAGRVRKEYVEDVFSTLEWLGIQVDEGPSGWDDLRRSWSQQLRLDHYRSVVETLKALGWLYPCTCSRTRIERRGTGPHTCPFADPSEAPPGTPWRLRVPVGHAVRWVEWGGSEHVIDLATAMPDPVMVQRDTERPAYQIASLVDDLEMRIDHIVRGADLVPSTACQLYLAQGLDMRPFEHVRFHHHPLITDPAGRKFSKSAGATSLRSMRQAGVPISPMADRAKAHVEALLARVNG